MDAILTVVVIAAIGLVLLVLYDKRYSLINFFKEKVFKPKPIKLPKYKEPKDITKQKDPDTEIKKENVSYGAFELPKEEETQESTPQEETSFFGNTIFNPASFEEEEDDFDIDKMLAEIEDEKREADIKKYASEIMDGEYLPDFDSMSIGDLDTLLEDSLSSVDHSGYFPAYDDDLSGAELGEAIKNLPKGIKIMIISDIFKRKF